MKKIFILFYFAICSLFAFAQEQQPKKEAKVFHVETTDGNDFYGEKINEDANSITLKTKTLGEIKIAKKDIKDQSEVDAKDLFDNAFLLPNAHSTRYFWSPNGFGLKKGEAYYQNTWVLLNQVSYGISDNLTMGVGVMPLFLFGGGDTPTPFWITPKVSIPTSNKSVNLGAGVIYANVLGRNTDSKGVGILYGLGTVGNRNKNITLGLGYGFAEGNWAKAPIVTISGMLRLGKRFYLLSENWFYYSKELYAFPSFGGRYSGKVVAFDFGLIRPVISDLDGFVVIPWLGVNVPFGKREK